MTFTSDVPEDAIDIGDDHHIKYFGWSPDRTIQANADRYANVPDIERLGAFIWHKEPNGTPCLGSIQFDTPEVQKLVATRDYNRAVWQVESWDPLTISPSVLCSCGDHGFIRSGRWVKA